MKAVRYEAPGDFAVTDVPMPPVGPLDVRIKIHQSGVCGTDVHLHHGTYMGIYPLPRVTRRSVKSMRSGPRSLASALDSG